MKTIGKVLLALICPFYGAKCALELSKKEEVINDFSEALNTSQKSEMDFIKKYCEADKRVLQLETENRMLKKQLKESQK